MKLLIADSEKARKKREIRPSSLLGSLCCGLLFSTAVIATIEALGPIS
jgi:hypothetical protein